ncbi:MAG: hypothetical protein V2A54_00755 [Bacteroidota bacterium]
MDYTFLLIYNIEEKETRERFEMEICMVVQDFIMNSEEGSHYWTFNSMLNKEKLIDFLTFICFNIKGKNDRVVLYAMGLDEDDKTLIVGDRKMEDWLEQALIDTYPARKFLRMVRKVMEDAKGYR